jgi:hypothetical protein
MENEGLLAALATIYVPDLLVESNSKEEPSAKANTHSVTQFIGEEYTPEVKSGELYWVPLR